MKRLTGSTLLQRFNILPIAMSDAAKHYRHRLRLRSDAEPELHAGRCDLSCFRN